MTDKAGSKIAILGKFEIELNQKTVYYTLKRSPRATLIWMNIKRETGLVVTVPESYILKYLPEYLEDNSKWILTNLEKYCPDIPEPPAEEIRNFNTISYLGKRVEVMLQRKIEGTTALKLEKNKLMVSLNSASEKLSLAELQTWLKSQAKCIINAKAEKFSQQIGLMYNRIRIRDQKSRWGSCSCRKNLNFNWRLIMAPEPVLDYVIIHELCHLKEMSHSKKFWNLVVKYSPQCFEHRAWLDNHCIELNTNPQM